MRANAICLSCILNKQTQQIKDLANEEKKEQFIHDVLGILYHQGLSQSAPYLVADIEKLRTACFGEGISYEDIKQKYNRYMLSKESLIRSEISQSADPIQACIQYVCAGNFIDFGAMDNIDDSMLDQLLEKAHTETIDSVELNYFKEDLGHAKYLLYITDNCGEIVLDKIFISVLQQQYPMLKITVMVRGGAVLNDATVMDARETGLANLVPIITNGGAFAGTPVHHLPDAALNAMKEADVIIAKGQGNFESLLSEGYDPYYFFLCKCELFMRRFGLKQFQSVFGKESRLQRNF